MTTETPHEHVNRFSGFLNRNPEFKFGWDTLKKIFIFTVIVLSVVGLNTIVNNLESRQIPKIFIGTLHFIEYFVFFCDVIWFVRVLSVDIVDSLECIIKRGRVAATVAAVALLILGGMISPYIKESLQGIIAHITKPKMPLSEYREQQKSQSFKSEKE